MANKQIEILEKLSDGLGSDDPELRWVVIGSASLELQGVKIEAHDLDILANEESFKSICKVLRKYLKWGPETEKTDKISAYKAKFNYEGYDIEILQDFKIYEKGNWEDYSFLLDKSEIVYIQGLTIPVAPLRDSLKAYSNSSRPQDQQKVIAIETRIKELPQVL